MNAPEATSAPRHAYHRDADAYDSTTAAYQKYRRDTVDLLPVRPGDVVLDVGCGTGLSFGPLEDKVGSTGHLLGIDASAPMVDLAAGGGKWAPKWNAALNLCLFALHEPSSPPSTGSRDPGASCNTSSATYASLISRPGGGYLNSRSGRIGFGT